MTLRATLAIRLSIAIVAVTCLLSLPVEAHAQQNIDRRIRDNRTRLDSIRRERESLEDELDRLRGRAHATSPAKSVTSNSSGMSQLES